MLESYKNCKDKDTSILNKLPKLHEQIKNFRYKIDKAIMKNMP